MPNSSNHAKPKTRFMPCEEVEQAQVRIWRFGDVALGGLGEGLLPPLSQTDDNFQPLMQEPLAPQEPVAQQEVPATEDTPEEPAPVEPVPEPGISEEEVQHLLEQARQEAFEQGLQQGQEQATAHAKQQLQDYQDNQGREIGERLAQVLRQAQEGIRGLQQQVAPDLLQLACDIARQVVRQELRTNPQALMPVVREALDMLGAETKPATVRIHPDDWKHLEAHVRAAWPNPKIEWLQDATVPAGDCWVESQGAQVDGSLEKRWQRAVAALGLVSTWYEGAAHG